MVSSERSSISGGAGGDFVEGVFDGGKGLFGLARGLSEEESGGLDGEVEEEDEDEGEKEDEGRAEASWCGADVGLREEDGDEGRKGEDFLEDDDL